MVVSVLRPTMQPGLHDLNSEPARLVFGLLPDVQICSMHNVGETRMPLDVCTRLGSIVQLGSTRVGSDPETHADRVCARLQ
jgi:hypothetical protein